MVKITEKSTLKDIKNKNALDQTKLSKSLLSITKCATIDRGKQTLTIESNNVKMYDK
jgi:hypothetical protein